MIDAYGRVVPGARLGLGEIGVIDVALPPPAATTPFRRWGEWPFALMMAISLLAVAYGRLNKRGN
jgi:apolipoprotein N-acyltransferase